MASKNWISPSGGLWLLDSNWSPTGRPTSQDDVVVVGAAAPGTQVVSGPGGLGTAPGVAGNATFVGGTTLNGSLFFSTLAVGTASLAGSLSVGSGALLTTVNTNVLYGPLTTTGANTRLTVSGTLTLGGPRTATANDNPTLAVQTGSVVQLGKLTLLPSTTVVAGTTYTTGTANVSVDATSSLEIGTVGSAALGKITVGAGRIVSGTGTLSAGGRGIIDNGVIQASGGILTLTDPVTGYGTLQAGTGATLNLTSSAPTTASIVFSGAGASLITGLATTGVSSNVILNAAGTVSGFVLGDVITVFMQKTVTSIAYTAGTGGGPGTLTLKGGTTTLGVLLLLGDFTGKSFAVSPSTTNGSAYDITLQQTSGSAGTPSPGTTTPDAYVWSVGTGGAWNDAVDWTDATTGASPAAVAPGLNNVVTIVGSSSGPAITVYGPGNSASLTFTGATTLNGTFRTGALSVGTAASAGALSLVGGTSLAAASATLLYGPLTAVGAGTRLSVSGALVLGGARSGTDFVNPALTVSGGASVAAASLTLAAGTSGGAITGGSSILVDATSTLEVGTAGHAALGVVTVDAGTTLTGAGAVAGASGILDNGVILAQGGELVLSGGVYGGGRLLVGANSALTLASGAVAAAVAFTGPAGVLTVTATGSGLNLGSVISGFAAGDRIGIATSGATITGVTYLGGPGVVGTLNISAGSTVLGTLLIDGDLSSYSFAVAARTGAASTYDIMLRPLPPDPLFDAAWYLAHNPDVAAAGVDPYQHFMTTGWKEGRSPNALFDTSYYLVHNPDVRAAGANPLTHFEASGWKEGRDPSAAFSLRDYLAANPDVVAARVNPLSHYIQSGKAEGRAAFAVPLQPAEPLIDAAYYYAHNPDVAAAGLDASAHYLASGWKEGRNPDAWFDTNYYLTQNPDVRTAGVDPLLHFESSGWKESRQPSLAFDDAKYLAANADVRAAGLDPLQHYLSNGLAEGRQAFLTGGTRPADPLIDTAYYDRQLGATLIPAGAAGAQQAAWSYDTAGWQKGLNPDAWFDTAYYLSHNTDVAAAHIDPLLHFENFGWKEGRDPSAQFSTNKYSAAYSDVRNAGIDPLLHYVQFGQSEGRAIFAA